MTQSYIQVIDCTDVTLNDTMVELDLTGFRLNSTDWLGLAIGDFYTQEPRELGTRLGAPPVD